ncbi:MAG: hypothetical protein WBD19_07580, partial [Candidatus Acidiferrum sp.]
MSDEDRWLFRIERIERENRRLKLVMTLSTLLSIVALALIVTGHFHEKRILEAQEILLKDSSGNVMARIGSRAVGACFEMYGKTKDASVVLCAGDDAGADLLLTTRHGDSRVLISAGGKMYETVGATSVPSLLIAQGGKGFVSLAVGTDPSLGMPHSAAQKSAVVSVLGERPTINLLDSNGKTLWS